MQIAITLYQTLTLQPCQLVKYKESQARENIYPSSTTPPQLTALSVEEKSNPRQPKVEISAHFTSD